MHDLRYALRTLRNRPAFAIAAVLTLAIATGANTAIFTVFYRVLLRPLPYREPDRLVFVWNAWKNGNHTNVSIPDYLDRRNEAPAIEDAALDRARPGDLVALRSARAGRRRQGHRFVFHDPRPRRAARPRVRRSRCTRRRAHARPLAIALWRRSCRRRPHRPRQRRAARHPRSAARRFRAADSARPSSCCPSSSRRSRCPTRSAATNSA